MDSRVRLAAKKRQDLNKIGSAIRLQIELEKHMTSQKPTCTGWLGWLWATSCCDAWVWLGDGSVKSVKSNSLPCVSAPIKSASSGSRNVRVWLLGPYASTLILLWCSTSFSSPCNKWTVSHGWCTKEHRRAPNNAVLPRNTQETTRGHKQDSRSVHERTINTFDETGSENPTPYFVSRKSRAHQHCHQSHTTNFSPLRSSCVTSSADLKRECPGSKKRMSWNSDSDLTTRDTRIRNFLASQPLLPISLETFIGYTLSIKNRLHCLFIDGITDPLGLAIEYISGTEQPRYNSLSFSFDCCVYVPINTFFY